MSNFLLQCCGATILGRKDEGGQSTAACSLRQGSGGGLWGVFLLRIRRCGQALGSNV